MAGAQAQQAPNSEKYERLKKLLAELFQLDQADLDFGIYRIMNAKRDEITSFLDEDLLPQIREGFAEHVSGDREALQRELDEVVQRLIDDGVPHPEESGRVQDLRQQLEQTADIGALEDEVYDHLYKFFRRYYKEGDFLSRRRYKEGVYALPYNGEEIKFHWANADQYYIKTSEDFTNYAFRLVNGARVRFEIARATTEQNNNKGKNRRFLLAEEDPIQAVGEAELLIRFDYKPDESGRSFDDIAEATQTTVVNHTEARPFKSELLKAEPTTAQPDRTTLLKHLQSWTARNTFDYFIHKDLDSFLRRELDFYIKNELMHLDDIESESAPRVESYLSKIRVFRRIADKLITFLAQLENFQKRMWLKKKFVVDTQYHVTLDKVPEKLYATIAANEMQREEWVHWLGIQDLEGYSKPLSEEFLRNNPKLLLNTAHFPRDFRDEVVGGLDNVHEDTNGLLIHGDNFQALHLLDRSLANQVRCIYIDPPYNTDVSAIPYKNNYRHSSFASLIHDRAGLMRPLLSDEGVMFVSIDKTERMVVEFALDAAFGRENRVEELIWVQNTNDGRSPTYSVNHEYVEVYARHRPTAEANRRTFREPKPGYVEVNELIQEMNPDYPPLAEVQKAIRALYKEHKAAMRAEVEAQGLDWKDEKRNNPWNGVYQYKFAEYRDPDGKFVEEHEAREKNATIWVFREDNWTIMSSKDKQSSTIYDPEHPNYRFYQPVHPVTGKPCKMSSRGWKGTEKIDPAYPSRNSWESLVADHRIAFGEDETKVPQQKRFLHEVETNVCKSVFADYSDGEKETTQLFGESGVFLAPKHTKFVRRFLQQVVVPDETVLDCFGGSGSTGHAVVRMNREENMNLKYVLVEVNNYFDTVLLPRILKSVYASAWENGKPKVHDGMGQCIKVVRLESYEDALNNLVPALSRDQEKLLAKSKSMREDYMLGYMLDFETRDSLLNREKFEDPFNFKLTVTRDDEARPVTVDMVETFNWLLGLRVKRMARRGTEESGHATVVEGMDPENRRCLIIWRNLKEMDSDKLDKWFKKQGYNTKDFEFDLIYVNGDNNLENLKLEDQTWKVNLIEEHFHKLMFDTQDV